MALLKVNQKEPNFVGVKIQHPPRDFFCSLKLWGRTGFDSVPKVICARLCECTQ